MSLCQRQSSAQSVTDHGLDHLFSDLEKTLTPAEVADLLRIDKVAIYRWLNDGYLPGYKAGNNWRILRDDLYEWMRQKSNAGRQFAHDDRTEARPVEAEVQESPDP